MNISLDVDYSKIFGARKSEMVDKTKSSFEALGEVVDYAAKFTGKGEGKAKAMEAGKYGINLYDQKYGDILLDATKTAATGIVQYGTENITKLKGLTSSIAASQAGKFSNLFVSFLLSPLELNANEPTPQAKKTAETEELKKNIQGAMLFYFLSNNQLPSISPQSPSKPVSDHAEDTRVQQNVQLNSQTLPQ